MQKTPAAPELWEQALINGRIKHPSNGSKAVAWAQEWYLQNGGTYFEDAIVEVLSVPALGDDAPLAVEPVDPPAPIEPLVAPSILEETKKVVNKKKG